MIEYDPNLVTVLLVEGVAELVEIRLLMPERRRVQFVLRADDPSRAHEVVNAFMGGELRVNIASYIAHRRGLVAQMNRVRETGSAASGSPRQ